MEPYSNKATSRNCKYAISFAPQIWWQQRRVRVRGVRPCNSAVSLEHVFLMILLWKTKQDFGREEGDVSRLMTCFVGMKNVSAAWDRHASWLGCERLMVRERMSILQTVATSRAHHVGFFFTILPLISPAAIETLPATHFLSHSCLHPCLFFLSE